MEDFSHRLQHLYNESEYNNVGELAKVCEVTYDAMSKYLEGVTRPRFKVLLRFRLAFPDVDYNWLLFGENGKK